MEQIKRYRLQSEMSQFYQGEYVKHADHLAQVKAVLAEQPVQPPAGVEAGLVGRMLLVYDRTYDGKSGCHNRAMAAAAAVALEGMMSLDDVEKAIRVTMKDLGHPLRDGSYVAAEVRARLAKPAEQTPVGDASIGLIAAERERQIKGEGWTLEHDDAHKYGELAAAASCYAHHANCQIRKFQPSYIKNRPSDWPWDAKWWKPSAFPVHNLVKAGALIVAELDRLARLAKPAEQERVAVKHVDGFWAVEVGVMQRASFLWADDAERYAAGLREELKAGKQ
jgi:hypothetical protein